MSKKTPRVAFLFTSSRDDTVSRVKSGEGSDTPLYGLNYIPYADYLTVGSVSGVMKLVRTVGIIPHLLRYDFVIAQDNLVLGYIVSICARMLHRETRWFYIAMNSSMIMRRHSVHFVRMFLLKKFWSSYARILCLSSEQIEDFVRFGISRDILTFVPFGVDADFFKSSVVSGEESFIVSVGRDAGRDYSTLFEVAKYTDHTFIIVASQKNIAPNMQIPANVTVLYDRSIAEVRDLYARARLAVVVSKDARIPEGSDCSGQTAVLDALSARKAVIVTRRAWITDYFVPGQDLLVVEPNDPKSLAHAINSLSSDAEKRERLAASGHKKVLAYYTTKRFADALCTLMDTAT